MCRVFLLPSMLWKDGLDDKGKQNKYIIHNSNHETPGMFSTAV